MPDEYSNRPPTEESTINYGGHYTKPPEPHPYVILDIGIPTSLGMIQVFKVCDEIETVLGRLRDESGCGCGTRDMQFHFPSDTEANNAKSQVIKIFRDNNILIDNQYAYILVTSKLGYESSNI